MNIIITLLIGAVAGWLSGFFVSKDKGGLIWNILIGLAGGFVGGWLLGKLGATSPFWAQWYGQIVSAVIGAVILLAIWNFEKRPSNKSQRLGSPSPLKCRLRLNS